MDTDQEDTRLSELRDALRNFTYDSSPPVRESLTSGGDACVWSDEFLGTLSTMSVSPLTTSQLQAIDLTGIQTLGSPWQINNVNLPTSNRISLQGQDADITINGESVASLLKDIRDRLNIIKVSEEMEAEWDELKELREKYESKLTECREKSQTWAAVKKAG